MKKIFIIIGILCLLLFSLFFFLHFKDKDLSYEDKLKNTGYSTDEVALILDKVAKKNYDLILEIGYDKSLINILTSLIASFNIFLNLFSHLVYIIFLSGIIFI